MEAFLYVILAAMLASSPPGQKGVSERIAPDPATVADETASASAATVEAKPEYVPMTFSERARKYIVGAFGPGAVFVAAGAGGIAQLTNTPKEWRQGAEAFGDRAGSTFAQNVIRQALEFGGSTVLRQDNRYFRSTESGFGKRSKHAIASVFVARTEGGGREFAYSRFGAVLGAAFLSRIWQPRSQDGAGDAAVSFGLNMAADIGLNLVHEFCPRPLRRRFHVH